MRRKLGTALAAAAMVVTVAGCGGGDDGSSAEGSGGSGGSSESSDAPESTEAEPEADAGGQPSVEELAAQIEASSDGSGTPEDYRCLAQVFIDNDVPADKVDAVLSDDPSSLGDDEAMALLDQLGPDLGKCYGAGG